MQFIASHYRRLPLRAKLALWVSLGAAVIVMVMVLAMLVALQRETTRSAGQVQAALIDGIVRDIDGKLAARINVLQTGGAAIGTRLPVRKGPELDAFFADRPVMRGSFDTLVLSDVDGEVVYNSMPPTPGQPMLSLADRAFFQEVLRTGRFVITPPLISKRGLNPVVSFASPVKESSGKTVGVLVGLMRLDRPNFISEVGTLRIGNAGYFTLTTRSEASTVISHPKAERLMKPIGNRVDPGRAAALAGDLSTTEGIDSDGMPALFTHRALSSAPWMLEAVYPADEAFAGLRQHRVEVLALGGVVAIVAWGAVWWLTTVLMSPLNKLRTALELDALGSSEPLQSIQADSADIAALVDAYYAQKRQRLATQAALDASERRLRDVTNNMPAFVAYLDRCGIYRYVNDRYRTVLGLDPETLLGKSIGDALNAEVAANVTPHIAGVLLGQPQTFEHRVSGHPTIEHLLVTYLPDIDARGEVIGFYSTTLDITARKRAELHLERSERRLKAITDTLPAVVAWVDRSQTYRFANARFKLQVGIDPEAVIGRTMAELLGPVAYAELQPLIDAALAGQHRKFERTARRDGVEAHLLTEFVPDVEADGSVSGFLIMSLDITQRRRMELALAHGEQRLRAITDNLPAMISHFDKDMRYTFANAKVGEVFGCDTASLIGKSALEVRGERAAGATRWMERALGGEQVSFEVVAWDDQHRPQHFEANYVPDLDPRGRVVGFYALTFEVTQRKEAEARLKASERLLDRTGSIAGVGGWELELESSRLSWTEQTRRIHEVDDDFEPNVTNAVGFYFDAGRSAIDRAVLEGMEKGTAWDLMLPLRTAKGRSIWVRATGEVEFDGSRPVRMFGAVQDVTQRVDQERRLREQAELLQVTLKSIGDGVITTDPHGSVQWMNPAAERMTGWSSEAARGRPSAQVFHVVHADTRSPAPNPVELCLRTLGESGLPSRSVLVSLDGRESAIEDSASPICDEFGVVRGAVLVFHDVSEQRRMNDQMAHRATHDELTGLVNRAEFDTRLARVFAKARDEGVGSALMFIDLDHFKLVNDACGHAMGDKLLCQVSDLMRSSVRTRDTLARLGGDEFGVLLEHCTVEQAQRVAQGICDRMDEFRFVHDGRRFRVGTSIGLVPVDTRWPTQAALRHAADSACYAAKEGGRNRVHVWMDTDASLHGREGETQWGTRLEDALDDGDFALYAQRIEASRTTNGGLHFEVLLRMREKDGSIVPPGRFFPAAERFHMASRIDRWVVRSVFEWLVTADQSDVASIETVAINLSGQSIGDRAFHRFVVDLLLEMRVDPKMLCFEVTETSAITNLADATAFIHEIRGMGCRIALDDFGAGASWFGYLKNLPVDYLKIDGQFIRNIENDSLDMAAVRCFHDVARAIGVQTVAEFVETASTRAMLERIGIDHFQGYLIHRPEPIDELLISIQK